MKECYFCQSIIPEDATVCPMCDSDLTQVESKAVDATLNPEPYIFNQEVKSRKLEKSFSFTKLAHAVVSYVNYHIHRFSDPISVSETEHTAGFGYVTILLASLLSASIVTKVVGALDEAYHFMMSISILPTLTVKFQPMQWFWKASVFFVIYFLLLAFFSFLFKKAAATEPVNFNHWVTQYTASNIFFFFVLIITFLLALVLPLALAIPCLLIVILHAISYVISFISSLFTMERKSTVNRTFYQSLVGISIHFLIMSFIAYFLIKL